MGTSTAGCGHPATREECSLIFDKSAELQLLEQNVTDPAVVAERTRALRDARGEELIGKCVGRTVTKGAMECIRKATSSGDVDRCLY